MTEEKLCASCGRRMTPRRRWREVWDEVRYCSAACRRRKISDLDRRLEAELLAMLGERHPATLCPSGVARRVDAEDWKKLMEPVRRAARRLAGRGEVRFLQKGRPVDPSTAQGPIRLSRGAGGGNSKVALSGALRSFGSRGEGKNRRGSLKG